MPLTVVHFFLNQIEIFLSFFESGQPHVVTEAETQNKRSLTLIDSVIVFVVNVMHSLVLTNSYFRHIVHEPSIENSEPSHVTKVNCGFFNLFFEHFVGNVNDLTDFIWTISDERLSFGIFRANNCFYVHFALLSFEFLEIPHNLDHGLGWRKHFIKKILCFVAMNIRFLFDSCLFFTFFFDLFSVSKRIAGCQEHNILWYVLPHELPIHNDIFNVANLLTRIEFVEEYPQFLTWIFYFYELFSLQVAMICKGLIECFGFLSCFKLFFDFR